MPIYEHYKQKSPWTRQQNLQEFAGLRLGVFIHFGLYSALGHGEWALNKEQIPVEEYKKLAEKFDPTEFDADAIVKMIKNAGAKYLVLTTMHHESFALYDSALNPFNSVKLGPKRNIVEEVVNACRKHNFRIHLYHSLNHWLAKPDAVDALENKSDYQPFIKNVHGRISELLNLFNPIDCLWYDGWWPFNEHGWQAEEMNQLALKIQPHIIFNGRNCLPGDFATPEQHMTAPHPWRPWEACITHNRHWGYHKGDNAFKTSQDVIDLLTTAVTGAGNLLINIGPDGKGRIPSQSVKMLEDLGQWTSTNQQAIYNSEPFTMNLQHRDKTHRGDFFHHGRYSAKENNLYLHLLSWPCEDFSIAHLDAKVKTVKLLGSDAPVSFNQQNTRVTFTNIPPKPPLQFGGVLEVLCDRPPSIYNTAGLRTPTVEHPRYDPVPSDIAHV